MATQKDSISSDVRLLREYNDQLARFEASNRAFERIEHYQHQYQDLMDDIIRFRFLILETEKRIEASRKKGCHEHASDIDALTTARYSSCQ